MWYLGMCALWSLDVGKQGGSAGVVEAPVASTSTSRPTESDWVRLSPTEGELACLLLIMWKQNSEQAAPAFLWGIFASSPPESWLAKGRGNMSFVGFSHCNSPVSFWPKSISIQSDKNRLKLLFSKTRVIFHDPCCTRQLNQSCGIKAWVKHFVRLHVLSPTQK